MEIDDALRVQPEWLSEKRFDAVMSLVAFELVGRHTSGRLGPFDLVESTVAEPKLHEVAKWPCATDDPHRTNKQWVCRCGVHAARRFLTLLGDEGYPDEEWS